MWANLASCTFNQARGFDPPLRIIIMEIDLKGSDLQNLLRLVIESRTGGSEGPISS